MKACKLCNSPIEPFMSFGRMPIANGFLAASQFGGEYFFELKVAFCGKCTAFQLTELVERERMFHENYAFYSSTSVRMAQHFQTFAEHVRKDFLRSADPFVVEIGSNDGIMLRHFAKDRIRHLGVEPSANVARAATERGVNTLCAFFDEAVARRIVSEHGKADAFIGANVMCHLPYLHSVASGIDILLKPDGIVMFEDPYLGDVVQKTSYDQIYDEHAFLFSLSAINYLFNQYGMEIFDVEPQATHGGSMRYVIARRGKYPVSDRTRRQADEERRLGLHRAETFETFRRNCEKSRDALKGLLTDLRQRGKRVVGYAATSKSTTVTNYCGLTPDLIEYISDTTPIKQGKFSPGVHIPVRPYEEFKARYPDYALLFGWNHAEEIFAKEEAFRKSGGKWIVFVPRVEVLP